jgi:hypothetical protein
MPKKRRCNRCNCLAHALNGVECAECGLWFCHDCYNVFFGDGCVCHQPRRAIVGDMVSGSYSGVLAHAGHKLEVAWYGPMPEPTNVSIECMDCMCVVVDFDFKEPPKPKKRKPR